MKSNMSLRVNNSWSTLGKTVYDNRPCLCLEDENGKHGVITTVFKEDGTPIYFANYADDTVTEFEFVDDAIQLIESQSNCKYESEVVSWFKKNHYNYM